MSEVASGPRVPDTWARGHVTHLHTQHNSAGLPWVQFDLKTSAGPLQCVCFPRSYASMASTLDFGQQVEVHGKPMSTEPPTIVILGARRLRGPPRL